MLHAIIWSFVTRVTLLKWWKIFFFFFTLNPLLYRIEMKFIDIERATSVIRSRVLELKLIYLSQFVVFTIRRLFAIAHIPSLCCFYVDSIPSQWSKRRWVNLSLKNNPHEFSSKPNYLPSHRQPNVILKRAHDMDHDFIFCKIIKTFSSLIWRNKFLYYMRRMKE